MLHQRPDTDKIYLYVKNLFESKYQLLINGREKVEIKKLKNPKAFISFSQTVDDVYENLEEYNPTKKWKRLIVLDDMIADMGANKKSYSYWIVSKKKKTQHFTYFHITILFQNA